MLLLLLLFFFPSFYQVSLALGGHSALRASEHSISRMEGLGTLSRGRWAGKVGLARTL